MLRSTAGQEHQEMPGVSGLHRHGLYRKRHGYCFIYIGLLQRILPVTSVMQVDCLIAFFFFNTLFSVCASDFVCLFLTLMRAISHVVVFAALGVKYSVPVHLRAGDPVRDRQVAHIFQILPPDDVYPRLSCVILYPVLSTPVVSTCQITHSSYPLKICGCWFTIYCKSAWPPHPA